MLACLPALQRICGRHHKRVWFLPGGPILSLLLYFLLHHDEITPLVKEDLIVGDCSQ
jgi:hypothetical protein